MFSDVPLGSPSLGSEGRPLNPALVGGEVVTPGVTVTKGRLGAVPASGPSLSRRGRTLFFFASRFGNSARALQSAEAATVGLGRFPTESRTDQLCLVGPVVVCSICFGFREHRELERHGAQVGPGLSVV